MTATVFPLEFLNAAERRIFAKVWAEGWEAHLVYVQSVQALKLRDGEPGQRAPKPINPYALDP